MTSSAPGPPGLLPGLRMAEPPSGDVSVEPAAGKTARAVSFVQQAGPERANSRDRTEHRTNRARWGTEDWRRGAIGGPKHTCGLFVDALKTPREFNGLEIAMRKFVMGAAAAAMIVGSSVAQAAPVADVRAASAVEGESLRGAGGTHLLLGLFAAVLLGFVLWQINDNDADDGFPVSP